MVKHSCKHNVQKQRVVLMVLIETDLIKLLCRNYTFEFESVSKCYRSELIKNSIHRLSCL